MSFLAIIRIALQALKRNSSRSLLTSLGIIIGVGAVITTMAIGSGAQAAVLKQIESLGANLIVITPGSARSGGVRLGAGTRTSLSTRDVAAIQENLIDVEAAAPYSEMAAQVVAGGVNWATSIGGTTPEWTIVRSWDLAHGRFFDQQEVNRASKVAVLGNSVAENLFPTGNAVGSMVNIRNVPFRVVGVLAVKGQSGFARDQDDLIVVPITTFQYRLTGRSYVNSIYLSAKTPEAVTGVVDTAQRLLRIVHHLAAWQGDDFQIRNIADVQQVRVATIQTQAILLAAIAVVSLIVGGIGIMNIMLVSVTERTREIGLRMAVGALGRDILFQFLAESIALACTGGAIGILFGVGVSSLVSALAHWPMVVTPLSIILGFVSSAAIGVAFGFYPARRAAALDPIVALRYE